MRAGSRPTPANAAMGQAGMPDALRITAEGFGAHPQHQAHARASTARRHGKVRTTFLAFSTLLPSEGAWAAGGHEFRGFEAYLSALPLLDRDDIAALALTVGILCFAVVSAILFVRTRRHLAEVEAVAHEEALASKAAIDRAYALLLSEPQVLVAWPAAADEPEIIGDPALLTTAGAGLLDFRQPLARKPQPNRQRGLKPTQIRQ